MISKFTKKQDLNYDMRNEKKKQIDLIGFILYY